MSGILGSFEKLIVIRADRVERQRYFSKLLKNMLIVLIAISVIYLAIRLSQEFIFRVPEIIIAAVILALGLAYILLRKGYFHHSAILSILVTFGGMTFISFISMGIRDGAVWAYIVLIIFTALILGKLVSLIVTLLSLISIWTMVHLENIGKIVYEPWSIEMIARDISLFLLITLVLMIYYESVMNRYIGELNASNADSREKNDKLTEQNREIVKINEDLRKAMIKADESDRLKTAFLTNLSHEIRTPMNGIIGFSELMVSADISNDQREEYNEIVTSSCQQLLGVVNDIIDISKIESGELEVNFSSIHLHRLVDEVYSVHFRAAENKELSFEAKKDLSVGDDFQIVADEMKVRQVLSNLISNAIKFTSDGFVNFGFTLKEDSLEFFVHDSGIGIKKEAHNTVFDRFIQIDSGFERSQGGTGLGLSIAKAYVEKMGGKIWIESEPGKGSQFCFTLPYLDGNQPEQVEEIISSSKGKGQKKVMIVEDVESNEILLKGMLKKYPFELSVARSGEEALELFRKHSDWDLIFMDIKLPDIDGYEVTMRIRKKNKNIPIIAQTAYAFAEDKKKALEAGCNDLLSKPITRKALNRVVDSLFS